MFGTIRKHSTWLWIIIITVIIISFVVYFSPNQRMKGNIQADAGLGAINGEPVTRDEFIKAQREANLRYFFMRSEWPDRNFDEKRETYFQLLFIQKQRDLGIHVGGDEVAKVAAERLRALNRGNPLALEMFEKEILSRRGLNLDDLERYFRHELGLQQLIALTAMSGNLTTPEEIRSLYARENSEISAQAAFFTATNYFADITVTPQALAEFYTNRMSFYRLPERVRVSYVKFAASNFLAEATKMFAELTNLNEIVESQYQRLGTNFFTEAKTPEEAKAKTRDLMFQNQMLGLANKRAGEIATLLYDVSPDQFETVARTNGLTVEVSPAFAEHEPPKELEVGDAFVKAAFGLTAEAPYAGPLIGEHAVYVIAPKQKLPSENPPFETVRERVTADYKYSQASAQARKAGEEFYQTVTNGLAGGKTFIALCTVAKVKPVLPLPFSISTRALPEVEALVSLNQFKQAAFTTAVGKPSLFTPMRDGGFIVFVSGKLPLDETRMRTELPNFTRAVRQNRQSEAFNDWFRQEAGRAFREVPYFHQPQPPGIGPGQ